MSAAELWAEYQQAKLSNRPLHERGRIYEAWFAQSFREGVDPTVLDRESPDLREQIAARSIPAPNGCLVWDGPTNEAGQPIIYGRRQDGQSTLTVRRHVLRQAGRQVPLRRRVLPVCGTKTCVNPDHLAVEEGGWTQRYSDQTLIGRLQAWAMEHGRSPTRALWETTQSKPSVRAYVMRFGSWSRAKQKAGIE